MRKRIILSLLLLPLVVRGEAPQLPNDKELKALVLDTLIAFNQAVQEKNFAKFHQERLSPQLRKDFTLNRFTKAFRVFVDKGYDISNIATSEPVFDLPPVINGEGLLVLKGYYPTHPNKVTFKLTYIKENEPPAWKVAGINVQATPPDTGKVPTDRELKALAIDSLLLFNVAIQTKSFEDFYRHTAKLWQKEVTPEKLSEAFKSFTDKGVNIAPNAKVEPAFEGTPVVNDEALLVLKGSYPTQPNQVLFELKYANEDGSWKLAALNVNLKPSADQTEKKETEKKKDNSKRKR